MYLTTREFQYIINLAVKENVDLSVALKTYIKEIEDLKAFGPVCSCKLR